MTTIARERTERKSTPRTAPRPKPRTCAVVEAAGEWWLLEIVQQLSKRRTQTDYYLARKLPAAFGAGFELEKQDTHGTVETYHVNLHGLDGYHTCDCRGFGAHAHCKHVEALLALQQAGKLPPRGELTAQVESYAPASIPLYRSVDELLAAQARPEQPPVRRFRSSADIARNAPELLYVDPADEDRGGFDWQDDQTFDLAELWEASGGTWEPAGDHYPPAA